MFVLTQTPNATKLALVQRESDLPMVVLWPRLIAQLLRENNGVFAPFAYSVRDPESQLASPVTCILSSAESAERETIHSHDTPEIYTALSGPAALEAWWPGSEVRYNCTLPPGAVAFILEDAIHRVDWDKSPDAILHVQRDGNGGKQVHPTSCLPRNAVELREDDPMSIRRKPR